MKKSLYFLSILILFLINVVNVNAKVIDYQFMGKKVNETFVIASNSSLSASTFINVTEDSTNNYLVVDLCSTANNNISVNVPTDLDGSYTMFYKSYDLKESCSTGSYNGTVIRLFFNTTTFADSGNGNMAINNITRIVNNASYTAVFKVISMGLTDTIDLSDLTVNNQNIIINNINGLQSNIDNSLSNVEQNINDNINNNFSNPCPNLFNKNNYVITAGYLGFRFDNLQVGKTYTITSNKGVDFYKFGLGLYAAPENSGPETWSGNITKWTFTVKNSNYYLFIGINGVYPSSIDAYNSYDFMLVEGSSSDTYCEFGSTTSKLDSLNETQKETNDKLDNLNDNITNSDSSQASGEAGDFFSNFNTDTFGLTSVITAPLELIKSVTSKTCTPLHGTLPFVDTDINLPCLTTIYENYFGTFLTIYRTITFGFVSYWVCIKIFNLVKDFKNPEHDEIEVLDL